jgi:hypothetical protein
MKLFFIIILLSLEFSIQKYLIFNLKKENYNSKQFNNNNFLKNEEVMENLLYNNYFTLINVGKPKKEIKFYISFINDKTILTDNEFTKSRSLSYKYNTTTNESIDIFGLNDYNNKNYIIKNYHFCLLEYFQKKEASHIQSILGLKPTEEKNINNNMLFQLKNNSLINKRIFSYINIENSENNFRKEILFIGELPEVSNLNIKINNFPKDEIKWTKIGTINIYNGSEKWNIKIDSFYSNYNTTLSLNNAYIVFDLDYNLIIGPENFRTYLLDNFMNKLIDKEICREDYFYDEINKKNYIYYICTNIDDFQDKIIYFKNDDLNETFEFGLGDIFYRYNKKLFFGIIFAEEVKEGNNLNNINVWKFGKIFLEKYTIVFDDENKLIGYYKILKRNDNYYVIINSFIIFFCFVILFAFIGYKLRKKKIISQEEKIIKNCNKNEKEKND